MKERARMAGDEAVISALVAAYNSEIETVAN